MISGGQIAQGAITDNKVGKNANIKHSKLEKANEGEVLVAQTDGKLKAVRISGDARMSTTGKLTVKVPDVEVSIDKDVVKKSDIKEGKTLVGGPTKPEEVAVGTGSNAIPQRDSSGNLKAETADAVPYSGLTGTVPTWNQDTTGNANTATNADKLDDQEGSFYLDVANHTGHGSVYEYTATSTSSNVSQSPSTFQHDLGYIPDVTVYQSDGETPPSYSEIDAEVKSTTTTTDVSLSEAGVAMKVIIKFFD